MYSFEPDEEQRMLVEAVERYALNDLREAAHDADENEGYPADLIAKGWDLGILQASIPEEYGGFGERSAVTSVLAAEAMGWGDLAGALAVMLPATYAIPILLGGTEKQKSELLPPIIGAEWKPFTAAFLEPVYDFHPGDMQTTAMKKGDSYILKGEKTYVPFADRAESFLIYASLDGQTQAFIVPAGSEGLMVDEREKLMGIGGFPCFSVKVEDLKVSPESRLGGENGFDFGPILASAQVAIGALAVGVAKAALDYALPYAKEREVWGVPIAQRQSIAFMLAEMAAEIEANRLLVWEAAWMLDQGKDVSKEAYLAYTSAVDMVMMVTDRAVQILGGYGFIREYPVELWMRNGRGFSTFTGLAMV
jgi:alkylation response protein AidB-like acyl-CoA dehydrogenase